MKLCYALSIALLLVSAPIAVAQSPMDAIGNAVHPLYIYLIYTVIPVLNELSTSIFTLGVSLCYTPPLCLLSPILFCLSCGVDLLGCPIDYGFPIFYILLGAMGLDPFWFIGGLGDLVGHALADVGNSLIITYLCMPLGSCIGTLGSFITLGGNGLALCVIGDLYRALEQFAGAALQGVMTALSCFNVLCCLTLIGAPISYLASPLCVMCSNVVGVGTDLLGQGLSASQVLYFLSPLLDAVGRYSISLYSILCAVLRACLECPLVMCTG